MEFTIDNTLQPAGERNTRHKKKVKTYGPCSPKAEKESQFGNGWSNIIFLHWIVYLDAREIEWFGGKQSASSPGRIKWLSMFLKGVILVMDLVIVLV
jgi:hypothetical protein